MLRAAAAGMKQSCFTCTKVQILALQERGQLLPRKRRGTQFTCFTRTKSTNADAKGAAGASLQERAGKRPRRPEGAGAGAAGAAGAAGGRTGTTNPFAALEDEGGLVVSERELQVCAWLLY